MKPRTKALELIDKFEGYTADCGGFVRRMNKERAIDCAIICAEEIISQAKIRNATPVYWNQVHKILRNEQIQPK